ncbi:hypothetical protein DICA0_C03180 [Diutina catenulata]
MSTEEVTRYLRSKGSVTEICTKAVDLIDGEPFPNSSVFVLSLLCDRMSDSRWRNEPVMWETLTRVWPTCDATTRLKYFRKVRLVEVVTAVINAGAANDAMFGFIDQAQIVQVDESQAISLLSAFVGKQLDTPAWVATVDRLFRLPQLDINYSLSKKAYTRFVETCVPGILDLELANPSTKPFRNTMEQVLYNKSMLRHFVVPASLSEAQLLLLFEIMVAHFQSVDLKWCEEFFTKIATSENAEALLEVLARTQKPLSNEFFAGVYQTHSSNWKLLGYLFTLDVELAIKHAVEVMNKATDHVDELASTIVDAFVKGRELPEFLTTVWPQMSYNFVDVVAPKIDDLTVRQITQVVPQLQLPALLAVSKGLNDCGYAKIDAVKEVMLSRRSENCEVMYYLASLYPDESYDIPKISKDPWSVFYSLRLYELGFEVDVKAPLLKLLKSHPEHLDFVVRRWLVLIEHVFTDDDIKKFVAAVDLKMLLENTLLYEQPRTATAAIDAIKNPILYGSIPAESFTKTQRAHAIDILYKKSIGDDQLAPKQALKQLLVRVTSQSELESNFDCLVTFCGAATEETRTITFDIASQIWRHHLHFTPTYVEQALKRLTRKEKSISAEMKASLVVLSTPSDLPAWTALKDQFVANITRQLKKETDTGNLTWLIWGLILTVDTPSILEVARKIPATAHSVQLALYTLMAKVYPVEATNAVYMVTLAYTLNSAEALGPYLARLSPAVFNTVMNFVLASLPEADDAARGIVTEMVSSLTKSNPESIQLFSAALSAMMGDPRLLPVLDTALSTKGWLFNQYSLEQTLVYICSCSSDSYLDATKTMSSVVLFHRYRLNQRHHMVNAVFVALMEQLASDKALGTSKVAAAAYARLLSNLCEVKAPSGASTDTLTSAAASIKKELRRHVGMLLVNYIHLSLSRHFTEAVQAEITPGIFAVFDVLSAGELQLVSSTLDGAGKAYYRTLYHRYKEQGKWQS